MAEIPICRCCGYPAPLKEYGGPIVAGYGGGKGKSMFCKICAATFLSHCITYPDLYGAERPLWSSIGWIANYLRDEIRNVQRLRDGEPEQKREANE